MTFEEFTEAVSARAFPAGLSMELKAVWHDAVGDWEMAHDIAQEMHHPNGAWIHAYLHRKEGDKANAAYWYAKANKTPDYKLTLAEEWEKLVRYFLSN